LEQYHLCQKQECLLHCFPMITELVCESNALYLSAFSSGRITHFMKNSPIQQNWRYMCTFWNNTICVWSRSVLHIVSLWELSQLVNGMLPVCHRFWVGETFTLCKIALFILFEGNKCIYWNNTICFRSQRDLQIAYIWEICYLEKNAPYLSAFWIVRNIHFMKNSLLWMNWRNTCISWNNTICVRSKKVLWIVSLWEFS
jgi:hypothetical protein